MSKGKVILSGRQFQFTLDRLCYQLIEEHDDFTESCLIGIQPRGVPFADRIYNRLKELTNISDIPYGKLDVTFYRDDFRQKVLNPYPTKMDFLVENKKVVLIDDVLYSGRTIRAALTALEHYGRANKIEMLCLINRRFNRHLPIKSDYEGQQVDSLDEAYVKVEWKGVDEKQEDRVVLYPKKTE